MTGDQTHKNVSQAEAEDNSCVVAPIFIIVLFSSGTQNSSNIRGYFRINLRPVLTE